MNEPVAASGSPDQSCDDAQASIPAKHGHSLWKSARTWRRLNRRRMIYDDFTRCIDAVHLAPGPPEFVLRRQSAGGERVSVFGLWSPRATLTRPIRENSHERRFR